MKSKVRNQPEWTKEMGTFYLRGTYDELITGSDEIWFLIDISEHIIHKYGSKEIVEKTYNNYVSKFRSAGQNYIGEEQDFYNQMADDLVMLNVSTMELDEINRALSTSGYIKFLLEKYKIL